MADTKGFSHITVGTDDDDDVVIQAGIAEATPEPAAAEAGKAGEAPLEFEPEPEPADEPDSTAAAEPETPRKRLARDDGYRETTLSDIEGLKMSTTQKAVIVVALVGIAAFVAWYLFAR
ncbi:SURF2 Surfeit locus protein 2 [Adlercreutzia caecimuris]|uniref:SURF2 Surfeit locus protein 2 n=1 Tax=Adlercreutzia caecimuris TaxID=671266 RepID=UPI000ED8C751|nr:SURF2 Surfeit locus protein 2 [Adlercreutzia caecimuris]NBJ66938.1 SURF2 Surfeit locus protein 2 [Adlercreutzia caecimuris]